MKYQYEEGVQESSKDGNGNNNNGGSGLRSVTYRPPAHHKSTTCLGSCSERRGSAVSSD